VFWLISVCCCCRSCPATKVCGSMKATPPGTRCSRISCLWHYLNHDTPLIVKCRSRCFLLGDRQTLGHKNGIARNQCPVEWARPFGHVSRRKTASASVAAVLLAIQPYFWFYSNEARPTPSNRLRRMAVRGLCGIPCAEGSRETWTWLFRVPPFFCVSRPCLRRCRSPLA